MQLWLRGVKHAPNVRFNLIYVHMLDDGGLDNHFSHGKWKLTKGNLVVARGEKISKLYWTKALVAKDSVNDMDMEASLLSYISEKWLNCLAKKDMLLGLKNAELEKCSHCMADKQTRVSFKKHPPSRKQRTKYWRSSNNSRLWLRYNKKKGEIKKDNRILIERVRCMLFEARLPKHFWGEALYTAMHFINLSLVVALKQRCQTRFGLAKMSSMIICESLAVRSLCMFQRMKDPMYLHWYDHDEYGYRMYDPVEKKLVRSHDVQFIEDQTIEDIDKVKKSTLEKDNSLSEIDLVWMPIHDLDIVNNNVQNDGFDMFHLIMMLKRNKKINSLCRSKLKSWTIPTKIEVVLAKRVPLHTDSDSSS
ncbi:hypothetical protein CR513_48731, partial [Mucuna pruriens]